MREGLANHKASSAGASLRSRARIVNREIVRALGAALQFTNSQLWKTGGGGTTRPHPIRSNVCRWPVGVDKSSFITYFVRVKRLLNPARPKSLCHSWREREAQAMCEKHMVSAQESNLYG